MSILPISLALVLALLAGCSRGPERAAVIGEAHVGPITLNIRQDLAPRSPTVATVKHGELLKIVQRRRRFVRVRTANGAEGWIDGRQLITGEQMSVILDRARQYAKALSMGAATVHDALNIHTEPNRQSPSFHQIPAQGVVDVLAHKLAPRVAYQAPSVVPPPKPAAPRKKKEREREKVEKPPMPPAPAVPPDWIELSKTNSEPNEGVAHAEAQEQDEKPVEKPPQPPPLRMDDWSLVRTKDGKVGWVVTRALIMAVPDEVAQYAEGHRITSYFSLGKVEDEGEVKHNWLWTTISRNQEPYEFDGLRVFIYNQRRNRYETAYIERNLKGYYPVQAFPNGLNGSGSPAFSLVVEDKSGQLYKRTYEFRGYLVRMIAKEPWSASGEGEIISAPVTVASAPQPEKSVFGRIKEKLFGR